MVRDRGAADLRIVTVVTAIVAANEVREAKCRLEKNVSGLRSSGLGRADEERDASGRGRFRFESSVLSYSCVPRCAGICFRG